MATAKKAGNGVALTVDGRVRGVIRHTIIGELLADGLRRPTVLDVLKRVSALTELRQASLKYHLAARMHIATSIHVYFNFFCPPDEWEFLGYEVDVEGVKVDLLWKDADGLFVIDEMKTGRFVVVSRDAVDEQLAGQLTALHQAYGDEARGVRVLFFDAPARSFLATIGSSDRTAVSRRAKRGTAVKA